MEKIALKPEGLIVLKLSYFSDFRGSFMETYNAEKFRSILPVTEFVQDNESISHRNVLRGLHFQLPPFSQGKLVRVIKGAVLDVAVDLRKKSPTYRQHETIILSEKNKLLVWIPQGFAHGFLTLENNTVFSYKCTTFYNKDAEQAILWNDKDLNINWGIENPILSDKDKNAMRFRDFISPF